MTSGALIMLGWVVTIAVKGSLLPFLPVDPMLLALAAMWILIDTVGGLLLWGHVLVLSQGALSTAPAVHWLFCLYALTLAKPMRRYVNLHSIPVAIGLVLGLELLTAFAGAIQHSLFGGAYAGPPLPLSEIALNAALAYPVVGMLRTSDRAIRYRLHLSDPPALRIG